jgi:DNA repair protein RadC
MKRKLMFPSRVWKVSERFQTVRRPEDMHEILKDSFPPDSRERFIAIYLDSRHKLMAEPHVVSIGTMDASLVHPREVFGPALACRACAIVVAHNHPSGNRNPSGDDMALTSRLDKAGELLGIPLLDHLIVSTGDVHGGEPMKILSIREHGWPSPTNTDD